jgi:hypothetical protein
MSVYHQLSLLLLSLAKLLGTCEHTVLEMFSFENRRIVSKTWFLLSVLFVIYCIFMTCTL